LDPERKVVSVRHPTDYMRPVKSDYVTSLGTISDQLNPRNVPDQANYYSHLVSMLKEQPKVVASWVWNSLVNPPARHEATIERNELTASLHRGEAANDATWAIDSSMTALFLDAINSARRCCEFVLTGSKELPSEQVASIYLLQAVIECSVDMSFEEIKEELPQMLRGSFRNRYSEVIAGALGRAERANRGEVEARLEDLKQSGVVAMLRNIRKTVSIETAERVVRQSGSHMTRVDQAVLAARRAAEAAVAASNLKQAAATLRGEGESATDLLIRAGLALEAALLPLYFSGASHVLLDLQGVLAGRDAPHFGERSQ
jgi:hypothetical protein